MSRPSALWKLGLVADGVFRLMTRELTPRQAASSRRSARFSSSSVRRSNARRTVSIVGTGSYVPEKRLTNDDLTKIVDTSDEWITVRTGIKERRIAAKEETTSEMATKAALKA